MIIVITPNAFADHIHWVGDRLKIILYDENLQNTSIELKKSKLFDIQTAKELLLLETPSKIDYICPVVYNQITEIIPPDQMKSFSEIQVQFKLNYPVPKEIKNTSLSHEITFLHYEPVGEPIVTDTGIVIPSTMRPSHEGSLMDKFRSGELDTVNDAPKVVCNELEYYPAGDQANNYFTNENRAVECYSGQNPWGDTYDPSTGLAVNPKTLHRIQVFDAAERFYLFKIPVESLTGKYSVPGCGFSILSSSDIPDMIDDSKYSEPLDEPVNEKLESESSEGGGCLIATAAFGSEMAPQVQFLREIRDNTVMNTQSGVTFMTGFNQFYYSFSPYVADYERENPIFKEAVKVTLTPLLTSLTLLNYVDIDTEEEMLGYGIGIILLNIGMYFVAPAVLIVSLKKRLFI
jgi:hypothetical protein